MAKITSFMRVTKTRKTAEDVKRKVVVDSPAAKPKHAAAVPTSTPIAEEKDPVDADGGHVVKYARKGHSERVSKELLAVVQYIQTHYIVPDDFERSHKYGPHSGMTFEKRLVRAYSLKLLERKNDDFVCEHQQTPEIICVTCAKLGHSYRECPDGF